MASMVAAAARAINCELQPPNPPPRAAGDSLAGGADQVKIVLQPRLCTLRSYASDRGDVMIRTARSSKEEMELTPFLANLYEYIESSKKSHDFEIITGRIAMMVFAATIGVELATGNSVFKKMDVQGISEGIGACLAAVACAAAFAYSSSARKQVGRILTVGCNSFIDSLIDNIVDGLFYDSDMHELSDNNDTL